MEAVENDTKSNPSVRLVLHIHAKFCIETKEISPKTEDTLIIKNVG
jgi:hypothetical protein